MPRPKKPSPTLFAADAAPRRRGRPPKNGSTFAAANGSSRAAARTSAAPSAPLTTAQSLGSIVKSARDIMRKDKGLNGDLDRLPMLTWIMFLKFLDDLERMEEEKAALAGKKYQPFIASPYRWRDWAAPEDGITGDALIAFVNQDEATLPGATKRGKGLFTYLRSLRSPTDQPDRRDTIARVFEGTVNRMIDGYLLRDVVNKINGIHFNATEEIHTLSRLYEGMLKEMRDAAGDSGEFYTPRPVVRLMVEVTDPRLGETVLDPAAGTGGFLVEAFSHLSKQVKTVKDKETLQRRSIFGGEPKPLPFLLCQMNLLLHGLEAPDISKGNSLAINIKQLTDKDRVDVILTNPPFGGEEQASIKANFPEDKQTAETALLFLQLIMRRLRRPDSAHPAGGRAAVVVPHGVLSSPGIAARIRRELLTEFNVHTIVRLPHNVFAPYTDIQTNLVFFERGGPTTDVLFCEPRLPRGHTFSKTKPLTYDFLNPLLRLIGTREAGPQSWVVDIATLGDDLNLDIKNPSLALEVAESPEVVIARVQAQCLAVTSALDSTTKELQSALVRVTAAKHRSLAELTEECDERIGSAYSPLTRLVGVSNSGGLGVPKTPIGSAPQRYKVVRRGYLVYNPMRINIGSVGVAINDNQVGITSPDYVVFRCKGELDPNYLFHFLRSEAGLHEISKKTKGSVRFRLYYPQLAAIKIPCPDDIEVQREFAAICNRLDALRHSLDSAANELVSTLDAVRRVAFLSELPNQPMHAGEAALRRSASHGTP